MICISIAQESRRFALVDMLNASRQCDLIEVRLDRFEKSADLAELLSHKPKPVIMSCRRTRDGGFWEGSEDERQTLLRQCIISKADYVEIELDIAQQIRPFPPAKRVVSYTNLQATPPNIAEIYADACTKNPDVVKLVTLARTPEEAWPLVQIIAKASIPTVVVGLGKPGIMLSILGKKLGASWTYAALERGMETYPAQPTAHDLEHIYHYRSIDKGTRFLGVTGFNELEYVTVGVLNAALAQLGLGVRCLPMAVGNLPLFRKVIDAVKLSGVVVDEAHRHEILAVANESESVVQQAQAADLLLRKGDQWHAFNTIGRAAVGALEATLAQRSQAEDGNERPLKGHMVMIVGTNATARTIAHRVHKRGGVPIIAGRDKNAALEIAQAVGCRHVPFEALYSTTHDVLVVCSEEKLAAKSPATGTQGVHSGYLKPSMTVMDLTAVPRKSPLLLDAEQRGCHVVPPRQVLLHQMERQIKLVSGQQIEPKKLEEVMGGVWEEES